VRVPVARAEITWIVLKKAATVLDTVRDDYPSADDYESDRCALQDFMCGYFSNGDCLEKSGTISPIGGVSDGGKIIKARWTRPGRGKSGSLRIVFVVYCLTRTVKIAAAYLREDDPVRASVIADVEEATKANTPS
jgi:hypothetical protein